MVRNPKSWRHAPTDRLDVLSIRKRRGSLGLLAHSEIDERHTRTRAEVAALVRIALGGLAAESLCLGDTTTGVASDLRLATSLAAQMVGAFGMAGSLISLDAAEVAGAGNLPAKVLADEAGRAAVGQLLEDARVEVDAVLRAHRPLLERLRDALLEHEELDADDLALLVNEPAPSVVVDLRPH